MKDIIDTNDFLNELKLKFNEDAKKKSDLEIYNEDNFLIYDGKDFILKNEENNTKNIDSIIEKSEDFKNIIGFTTGDYKDKLTEKDLDKLKTLEKSNIFSNNFKNDFENKIKDSKTNKKDENDKKEFIKNIQMNDKKFESTNDNKIKELEKIIYNLKNELENVKEHNFNNSIKKSKQKKLNLNKQNLNNNNEINLKNESIENIKKQLEEENLLKLKIKDDLENRIKEYENYNKSRDNLLNIKELINEVDNLIYLEKQNKINTISEIYDIHLVDSSKKSGIYMIDIYKNSLPLNLTLNEKKASIDNILKGFDINKEDLNDDAILKIEILKKVKENNINSSNNVIENYKNAINILENAIDDLKDMILEEKNFSQLQDDIITNEIKEINDIKKYVE